MKHHVYVKRQTRIGTTWPSFPFTCRLLFTISTDKLVVSRNFLSIRIALSCFYLLIFFFEKFLAWIWRLPFAVYVKLKLSGVTFTTNVRLKLRNSQNRKWAYKNSAQQFFWIKLAWRNYWLFLVEVANSKQQVMVKLSHLVKIHVCRLASTWL